MNNFVKIKSMRHDERQSLYVKFDPLFEEIERLFRNSSGEAHEAYSKVLDVISDMAATDKGESVKHGHWIDWGGFGSLNNGFIPEYKCSVCNSILHSKRSYCGNCGAKMDGGEQK